MEVSLEKIQSTQILLFIGVMKDSSSVVPLKLNARQMEHGAELQVFVKVELIVRETLRKLSIMNGLSNRPFAGSGHMVRDWDASYTVSKQRNSYSIINSVPCDRIL